LRTSQKRLQPKLGVLGLGSVGRKVVEYICSNPTTNFKVRWIADSSKLFGRKDGKALDRLDLKWILKSKSHGSKNNSDLSRMPASLKSTNFQTLREEISLIQEEVSSAPKDWMIIDSTHMDAASCYKISSSVMGVSALITANKTAWANRKYCRKLFSLATEVKTLLSLNCTLGVWADQLEYVPLLDSILGPRKGVVIKRDNSSLNLFFASVGDGLPAKEALAKVAAGGYLEPGATDLRPEVEDQIVKLKVLTNVCAATTHYRAVVPERKIDQRCTELVPKAEPEELARWHLSGRSEGRYPALVSSVRIDGLDKTIESSASFIELEKNHPLAMDLFGKNAISIQIIDENSNFVNTGYGGASKTAKKLLWEADRAVRLLQKLKQGNWNKFDPIPLMTAVKLRDPDAVGKQRSFFSKIS
jgi:homoserine dehydrogenase